MSNRALVVSEIPIYRRVGDSHCGTWTSFTSDYCKLIINADTIENLITGVRNPTRPGPALRD